MSSQPSSIRTSLQDFRERVKTLVEIYEPYLEFINERQLLSAIFSTIPNASSEDLIGQVETNNNSASRNLINSYIVNAFLNISTGGSLACEFSLALNGILSAASSDDASDTNNFITATTTQEPADNGQQASEVLMSSQTTDQSLVGNSAYLSSTEGSAATNETEADNISATLTTEQVELIKSRFFSCYPNPNGQPEHNIFNANIPTPALEIFSDESYINYLDPYNLEALQTVERIRIENPAPGSGTGPRDPNAPDRTRATVDTVTFQPDTETRRTIGRTPPPLTGIELRPYNFNTEPLNSPDPNNPASGPNIVAIVINDINLMPASRDTGFTELFLNFVPSVEMSRSVPYLDIGFIMPDGSNTQESSGFATRPAITTLASALGYTNNENGGVVNLANALFDGRDVRESGEANSSILSGVELFLAPQTLGYSENFVEPDDLAKGNFAYTARPLDRFKPIASFLGITFDVSTTHGVIPYKTAKMSFKVHDRGRLHEMAMFIKPELYSKNHLYIEYGWSHPDNDIEKNPFGYLINTLRTVEKYAIVNSSFNMDASGEIKLDVELAMQGADRMAITDISRGEGVESVAEKIDEVIETIQRALNRIASATESNQSQIQEIFGQSLLGAISSTDNSVTLLNEELQEQINQTIKQLKSEENPSNPNMNALRDGLVSLYGDPDESINSADKIPLVRQLQATIAASVELKRICLYNACDPWISRNLIIKRIRPNGEVGEQEITANGSSRDSYVSLAKALMLYVGKPLMSTKKFAEVQFLFYPFNANSGNLRNQSTASFPLKRSEFLKMLTNATKLTANLPIERFINLVNLNFVANIANEAYGMSELYELADETGNVRLVESLQTNQTRVLGLKQQLLQAIYGGPEQEIRFSQPSIKFILEAVPRNLYQLTGESENSSREDYLSQTILKIHVIDERCTPYESAGKILKAARSNQFNAIRQATDNESDVVGHIANANLAIEMAINEGLLESLPNNVQNNSAASALRTYRVKGGTGAVKKFIRKSVPTIRFGTNGSALLDASFSSMNDPALSTINMRRASRGGDKPPGIMDGGLPLEIHPTEASMTTIGFPFFGIAQQFFIDFDTGTTADNIYGINSVSHEIGPGFFKSSVKLLRTTEAFGEYRSFVDQIANALNTIPASNSDNE